MSADFREEPHQIESKEKLTEEEIIKALTDEFNAMFTRENLEANPYLIFKMNPSLEIPVTAIYKDKRVSSICTNLAIIRELYNTSKALSKSTNITYNKEKEVIVPNLKRMKNKIVLNKIPDIEKDKIFKAIYQAPEFLQKISDKHIENLKSYTLIMRTDQHAEAIVEKIKAAIRKDSTLDIHLEYEDLYLDLLQKAQDNMKNQRFNPEDQNFAYEAFYQNYGYYYGVNPFANPYMGMMAGGPYGYRGMNYNNQYYNNYQNQMFIRKAQDETNEPEPQRGEYSHYSGKKKDRFSKKPYFQKQQKSDSKNKEQISTEEIQKRTRLNSENFPRLVTEEQGQAAKEEEEKVGDVNKDEKGEKARIKHTREEIIKIFKQVEDHIKPNEKLLKLKENTIPVLDLHAKPTLEFLAPAMRKHSEHGTRKGKDEVNIKLRSQFKRFKGK